MPQEKYKIVLVEDSDDDVVLFELALKRTDLQHFFEITRRFPDGDQAIRYFSEPPSMVDPEPRPDIVILDIKLPGRTGFEVLVAVRDMGPPPAVAVFTTSILPEDQQRARELGADLFQTKTFESTEFSRFLHFLARIAEQRRGKRP